MLKRREEVRRGVVHFDWICLDVRTLTLFANYWVFRIKPLKLNLLAGAESSRGVVSFVVG